MTTFDVIVVGAGAAGLMCAAEAGLHDRRVLLLDHAGKIGERIRISGGGRCNFTNLRVGPENYLSQNPHFIRSALSRYTAQDFIDLVDQAGIEWDERKHGQLFCRHSARDLITLLTRRCDDAGVDLRHPVTIDAVSLRAGGDNGGYRLETSEGTFDCSSLVVATGGLAVPKLGASPWGYRLAEQFGHRIIPTQPALVPLALAPETLETLKPLAGISLPTETGFAPPGKLPAALFTEDSLITHRGLSGPAILQISSYWQMQAIARQLQTRRPHKATGIVLNLLPGVDAHEWLTAQRRTQGKTSIPNLLAGIIPRRFAQQWCMMHGWQQPLGALSGKQVDQLAYQLSDWTIMPAGTLGYAKAEVTLGGVDTAALSSKTMESRIRPGLFFIGEVVDVTGWLGGYNFQWAWSSGWVAGQYA